MAASECFFIGILSNTTTTSLLRAVHHFGRAVIMFGVPYVYTQSRILKVRTKSPPTTAATKRPSSTRPASCPDSRPPGSSGIPAGSLPDQGERLPHVWRHATRRPVRGPSHPRENRLRPDDLCRQGEFTFKTGLEWSERAAPEACWGRCPLVLPPLSAALRPSGQTREAPSLDSGAHQRRQPESHRGRDHPALQALPATDGSAVQTGSLAFLLPNINHWGVANTNGRKPGNLCIVFFKFNLNCLNGSIIHYTSRTHCYITHKNVSLIPFLCIIVMMFFFFNKVSRNASNHHQMCIHLSCVWQMFCWHVSNVNYIYISPFHWFFSAPGGPAGSVTTNPGAASVWGDAAENQSDGSSDLKVAPLPNAAGSSPLSQSGFSSPFLSAADCREVNRHLVTVKRTPNRSNRDRYQHALENQPLVGEL